MQRLKLVSANIRNLSGWRALGLAVVLGALSVLSLAPVFAWPIMFVTMPGFILLLDGAAYVSADKAARDASAIPLKKMAAIGWAFGFGYFFASLFWIGEAFLVEAEKFAWALPFAISLLPAGLAFYFALATAVAGAFWRNGLVRILLLAVTLTVTEWLRGQLFTGFPWNVLGYTLTGNDGLMQLASVFGAYGLTPIAVLIFASPVLLLGDAKEKTILPREYILFPAAMVAVLLVAMGWGYMRHASPETKNVDGVLLRLVQPNTPQKDKWVPSKRLEVFNQLIDTTTMTTDPGDAGLNGVTHVIWPESSFPFLVRRSPEAIKAIADLLPEKTILLTGALRMEDAIKPIDQATAQATAPTTTPTERKIYNSMLAIDTEGRTLSIYDKMHLVPFGEYLPFQNLLEAIGLEQLTRLKGGFASGNGPRILHIPGAPLAEPLICYEIIFPARTSKSGTRPKWLLNLTNDAWFGRTSGPHQHFHQARIRAIEEGLPVVRVANTGISAVIDPYGRIVKKLPLMTRGAINSRLPAALDQTAYTTLSSLIIWIELVTLLGAIFIVLRRTNAE